VADQDFDKKNSNIKNDESTNQISEGDFWEFEVYTIMKNSKGDVCSLSAETAPFLPLNEEIN
jgi:hypothetical protein